MKTQEYVSEKPEGTKALVQLTFTWEDDSWRIVEKGGAGNPSPKVPKKDGTISWELPDEGLAYAVLQLNPFYFNHRQGSPMDGESGIVILAKKGEGKVRDYVILEVKPDAIPSPQQPGLEDGYVYVYTALCMNEGGEVEDIEDALRGGEVGKWLAYRDLTFCEGPSVVLADAKASPPSMIIM